MLSYFFRIGRVFVSPVRVGIGIGVRKRGAILGAEYIGNGQAHTLLVLAFVIIRPPLIGYVVVVPENRILCVA